MTDAPACSKSTFAAGCFREGEDAFRMVEGVTGTVALYTGGTFPGPTYEHVESGTTGHVEAVRIVFDPAIVTFGQLLDQFWAMHNQARAEG